MDVQNATLKDLVQGEKQFRVPIWQRRYTWRSAQHEQLWHDLGEQYDVLASDETAFVAGHFLGSFVLSPFNPHAAGVQTFLVVDGQQRLTTLMLVLCALRDFAEENGDTQAVDRLGKLYLYNEFKQGAERYRVQPTDEDREAFRARIDKAPDNGAHDLISDAYRYYAQRLRELRPGGQTIEPAIFERAIAERMAIVEITTQHGDNAHRIFQSLNGTGVDLNQADLLRNYFFMLLPTRSEVVYEQVWRPMEALVGVDNLAGLARVDLQRRGLEVTIDQVYAVHQRRLDPIAHDEAAVEGQIRDLARRATHYKRLIDPVSEGDSSVAAALGRLARWGAQTTHPVLMVAYDLRDRGLIDTPELRRVLDVIESFFVRRQLARIPTNTLSRMFVQLVGRLPEGAGFADALHRELSRPRRYWPDNSAVRHAAEAQPFFHIGRPHQRKMILEQIERSFEHPEVIDFEESVLQVEHIMPQTLSIEWRDHLEALGQDPDAVHIQLVHTLGNLTLTGFNGALSNNPFERKKEIYGDSNLQLNRALVESDSWGRNEILDRAADLAAQICEIWVAPLPGVPDVAADGYDWTRVGAAIEAIPLGRWTTYGDLAELGGTAAQPVGNFITGLSPGSRAYRVLSADGRPSAAFRCADPHDEREVEDVLRAEGINFVDGQADPGQRITSAELAAALDSVEQFDDVSE